MGGKSGAETKSEQASSQRLTLYKLITHLLESHGDSCFLIDLELNVELFSLSLAYAELALIIHAKMLRKIHFAVLKRHRASGSSR